MSKFVKIFIIVACFIVTANFASLSFAVLVPVANASEPTIIDIRDKLVVPLGSYTDIGEAKLVACQQDPTKKCWQIPWLAKYIGNMYRYGVVIGSMLAVVMIMIGGVLYLIGGLNPSMISRGKEYITGAVTGLVLLLGSYVLLQTINPNLVNLKPIEVEIIKESKITSVKFCSELPADKYTITGDSACGGKNTFVAKDTNVDDKGECIGDVCTDKKKCVPATPTSTDNYLCKSVLIWGQISDPTERYLDGIWIYTVQGNDETNIYSSDKEDKGQTSYYIYKEDLDADAIAALQKVQSWVLKIELNDTGYEKQQLTYGNDGADIVTGVTGFFGANGTSDDEYFVGHDAKLSDGLDTYVGVWVEPTCETCGGAHPTKPGTKPNRGDGWMYDTNCQYFWTAKMLQDGVRIDIDAKNFREDSDIDCELMKMLNPQGPKYEVGHECGSNSQCASGDCESEGGIKKCECNSNSDCPANSTCRTTAATWNVCAQGKKPGQSCSSNDECYTNDCATIGSKCDCDSDSDCNLDEFCVDPAGPGADVCLSRTAVGSTCTPISGYNPNTSHSATPVPCAGECKSSSWYDLGPSEYRCQCLSDDDCTGQQKCIKVNDGCGWNYCANKDIKVPSVPPNYKPAGTDDKKKGLCWVNGDCESNKCGKDAGWDNCDVCVAN